jgi:hypothetical protein
MKVKKQQSSASLLKDMACATALPKVGFEDHPLCSDPEGSKEQDKEEPPSDAEKSAPAPAPERSADLKTRAVDLEEESGGNGLSNWDEAMSKGNLLSGEDHPQFAGPPNPQQLVCLGQEHCRTPCCLTNNTGVKAASICSQKVKDCEGHATAPVKG